MTVNKEKNFISAVVYVSDDGAVIGDFITNLYNFLNEMFEKFEIICVDDDSTDDSVQVIKSTAKNLGDGKVTLLKMSYFQGIEPAMNAGIDLAIGDFVLEFDSSVRDYEMSFIKEVYSKCLEGYDIVAASGKERLSSKMFYGLYNNYASTQYRLESETFRILSRRAINRIHSMSDSIPYRKAVYANCGLKKTNIHYKSEMNKRSKISEKQKKSRRTTGTDIMILYTDVAFRLSMFMSVAMMLGTLAAAVYTVVVFVLGHPITGYTTTMLVMTGSFFGVFAILAIILKYLSLIISLIFKKQSYLVEYTEKIT